VIFVDGSSENLNDSIGLADPENPHTGAKFWDLSEMRAELLRFLCGNFHIFVTMATGVVLTQISLTQLNRQFPKTPIWRRILTIFHTQAEL